MKPYQIQGDRKTPNIQVDPVKKTITLKGISSSENAFAFYKDVIQYIDHCIASHNPIIHAEINLTYFNTSSAKCLLDILERLTRQDRDGNKVKVTWYYEEDDEEMLDSIRNYSKLLEYDIKAVPEKV